MAMNRRNVLIGLGTVAAGGGAVLGTGAFSTVEAERTMSVGFSDDSGAELILNPTSSYASSSQGTNSASTLDLTFNNLNDDATTTLSGVFEIDNNDSDGNPHDVYIDSNQSSSEVDGTIVDFRDSDGNSIVGTGTSAATGTNLEGFATSDAAELITVVIDSANNISSSLNVIIVAD